MQYDRDRSGTVEPNELQAALTSWGKISLCNLIVIYYIIGCL